jgi:HK97 family phage prohead protease
MPAEVERRFLAAGSVRVEERGTEPPYVTGVAAPFFRAGDANTEYQLYEQVFERIMPGAFDRALRECDVRALFNHDPNFVLGRREAGTMELWVDDVGLRYRIKMPDTYAARDVVASIKRGDVTGSSFSFIPYPDGTVLVHTADGRLVRELRSVQLFDVGPVTFPAYEATSTAARAAEDLGAVRAEVEQWKEAEKRRGSDRDAVRARTVELSKELVNARLRELEQLLAADVLARTAEVEEQMADERRREAQRTPLADVLARADQLQQQLAGERRRKQRARREAREQARAAQAQQQQAAEQLREAERARFRQARVGLAVMGERQRDPAANERQASNERRLRGR